MRNRIIMAAIEEINLRGFKFTMSDLSKRLRLSKSSLYEHFSSKEQLIAAILDIGLNDIRLQEEKIFCSDLSVIEKMKALITITPKTFEPFYNRVYDELRLTYPQEWEKVLTLRRNRMDRLADLLNQGIETGSVSHVNVAVVQQMIISSLNDMINYSFLANNNMTYIDAVAAMLDVIMYGVTKTAQTGTE